MGRIYRDLRTGWYVADYFDAAGKRHRDKVSRTLPEARQKLALLEGKVIQDQLLGIRPLKRIRFGEYARRYLEHARAHTRSWSRYRSCLKSLQPFFGNLYLTAIDAEMIEQYKQARRANVTPATVNRDLQTLRRMLNLAMAWGYLHESPMRFVKLFRESTGRVRYLTRKEFGQLLQHCPPHIAPIVTVAVHTGMRQGELLSLTWRDVDLENGFLSVNDPKNATPRKVPLNATARVALSALREGASSVKVFCDGEGEPLPSRTLQWQFKRAMKEADILDFRFHDLRHTCASWLAMAKVPVLTIKEVLGHKDIRMTLRYAHLAPDQQVDAVRRLDEFTRATGA